MPRISRESQHSKYQHIMVQGINREHIFKEECYIKKYKDLIGSKLQDSKIKILSYCIMSNHAHFLMYSDKIEYISKFMHKLNTSYSRYYNKENNRVGYVFRNRYKLVPILNQGQLYTCLRYIHYNPIKANLCTNLEEYKHSSYNEFFGKRDIISEDSIKILFDENVDFKKQFEIIHRPRKDIEEIKLEPIGDFIKIIEEKYKINIKDIRKNKELLKLVIGEARKFTNIKIVELAEILDISKTTVGVYSRKEIKKYNSKKTNGSGTN